MSTAREILDLATSHARKVKDDHVREVKAAPGLTDIPTFVEGFRAGEPALMAQVRPHRDMMLNVASLFARGGGVDVLALTYETYTVHTLVRRGQTPESAAASINPDTGREWEQGELAAYFAAHGPDGVVSEALVTTVATRSEEVWMISQPYRLDDGLLTWHDLDNTDSQAAGVINAQGLVPDALRKIMRAPTIVQSAQAAGFADMHPERLLAQVDIALTLDLPRSVATMSDPAAFLGFALFAAPGTVRHQTLVERFGKSGPLVDPRRWN